jgi:hypothetical protein
MEPLLSLPADQFRAALAELQLDPQREADLVRQYRRANSPLAPIFGLLDRVAAGDAGEGMQRASMVPVSRPEGMSVAGAVRSGDARLAVPQGVIDAVSALASGVDAPAAAARGLIPAEDMVGEAMGTAGVAMGAGGLLARPAGSVGMGGRPESNFGDGWSDAYHWTRSNEPFDQFDPDLSTSAMSQLGPHVGTRAAAEARTRAFPNEADQGQMMQLRADMRRPFLNPRTNEPWSETGLEVFISQFADEHGIDRREAAPLMRRMLAEEGFTDIPYINDIEDAGSVSNIMLVDRPQGSDAVLRRQDAAFDPARSTDPNLLAANRSATAGLLASAASDTPAQRVARLLREGRADEVTDDLMAQADPQEMFRLYQAGETGANMPMDEASRMARAAQMGFDAPVYHGGTSDIRAISQFEGGAEGGQGVLFSSDEARVANTYAPRRAQPMGENVTPLIARSGGYREAGYTRPFPADGNSAEIENWLSGLNQFDRRMSQPGVKSSVFNQQIEAARANNQPGVVFRQVVDDRIDTGMALPSDVFATVDPTSVRSRFARFDPRLSHLANLNAANISPLAGLLAIMQAQEPR